jgi:ribulose-phosphate 3-epimerase
MISQKRGLPYWREVTYEFDLMIDNPADVISDYIQIGASGLIIHYSSTDDLFSLLEDIQDAQMDAGVALVPQNFAENIDISSIARVADFIQLMGNDDIGKHGVSLDPNIYEYVRDIRDIDETIDIAIDIGVNHTTAPELTAAGATTLVSGSSIFGAPDIEQAIIELEKA